MKVSAVDLADVHRIVRDIGENGGSGGLFIARAWIQAADGYHVASVDFTGDYPKVDFTGYGGK